MDLGLLKELVRKGEGEDIEFKLKAHHPDKIVREVVAFANSGGGKLIIGVSDDKIIKGVKFAEEDEFALARAFSKYCFPPVRHRVDKVAVSTTRDILVYSIPRSTEKPHYVLDDRGIKKVYVRVGDRSVQASSEMCQIMKRTRIARDTMFTYGKSEQKLMELLASQASVTVESYARTAGISRQRASRSLILLVLANVLEVHPDESKDHFTMAMR